MRKGLNYEKIYTFINRSIKLSTMHEKKKLERNAPRFPQRPILDADTLGDFFFFTFLQQTPIFSYNEHFYLITRKLKIFKEDKIMIKLSGLLLIRLRKQQTANSQVGRKQYKQGKLLLIFFWKELWRVEINISKQAIKKMKNELDLSGSLQLMISLISWK